MGIRLIIDKVLLPTIEPKLKEFEAFKNGLPYEHQQEIVGLQQRTKKLINELTRIVNTKGKKIVNQWTILYKKFEKFQQSQDRKLSEGALINFGTKVLIVWKIIQFSVRVLTGTCSGCIHEYF